MANRTNATDVKAIIDTQLTITEVTVFINTANLIVTTNLGSKSLSVATLTEIEKWVSAHLIAITKTRQALKKKVGDAEDTYTTYSPLVLGIRSTTYGQTALILDSSGTLGSMGLKAVTIEAIPSFDDSPLHD